MSWSVPAAGLLYYRHSGPATPPTGVSRLMNASERERGGVAHTQGSCRAAHTDPPPPPVRAQRRAMPSRAGQASHPHVRLGGGSAGSSERAPGGGRAGRERRGGAGPVAFAGRSVVNAPTHSLRGERDCGRGA